MKWPFRKKFWVVAREFLYYQPKAMRPDYCEWKYHIERSVFAPSVQGPNRVVDGPFETQEDAVHAVRFWRGVESREEVPRE